MLTEGEGEGEGSAAFSAGCESVSQFSREYAHMFGDPPRRETKHAGLDLTGNLPGSVAVAEVVWEYGGPSRQDKARICMVWACLTS
ncbi:MAG: hypothetical protein ACK4Z5_04130 [Brevundimonas sp.]